MANGMALVTSSESPRRAKPELVYPMEGKEAGKWSYLLASNTVHPFDQIAWKIVDARIINPDGRIVFEQKNVEVPSWWNQTTINVVAEKYFRVINGVREHSVKQMLTRVATVIRKWGEDQDYFGTTDDARTYEYELIAAMLHQYGAFNSPVWFNIGVPGRKQTASACFISSVDDSIESIIAFQSSELNIFKGGSGSGANLSRLRSSYEKLSAGSYTSGPLAFMRGLDQFAGAMKSGGATRNAAKMVILDVDHPDILETRDKRPGFIRCKAVEEKRAHDLIDIGYGAAYDDPNSAYKNVMYQNANHSVSISDAFMDAVLNDKEWHTHERTTGRVVHTYKAREIWTALAEAAWTCGDPGVQFNDVINRWHTTPHTGKIRASNPCSEFLCIDNTACNLCGINIIKFFEPKFSITKFEHVVRLFVTAQNIIINKASYPTEVISDNTHLLRPIGLNYGNLGALLMKFGYGYDSDEGRVIAARLSSLLTSNAYIVSAKLAARVGAFPEFEKNKLEMLSIMKMHQQADSDICERWNVKADPLGEDVISRSAEAWREVVRLGNQFGFSISQATLQAPLGTTSFMMGMDTTGIEPAYALVSYKSLVGGGKETLVNHTIKEALINLGYSQNETDIIYEYVEQNGYVEGAPGFKTEHLPVFDCAAVTGPSARCLSPLAHLEMMAAIQPLITCGQSKTVNLPEDTTAQEMADLYMDSWKLGLKCVALYRCGCKRSQPLSTKNEVAATEIPPVRVTQRRPLPEDCRGYRHRFEISGHKGYIIMNEYPDGTLGEVFLKLGRSGSTLGGLIDGFTQLLSIALQYGVPLDKLVRSFVHTKFEPLGITRHPRIHFADSIFDYLFKYLDLKYYEGRYSGLDGSNGFIPHEPESESTNFPSIRPTESGFSLDAPPCGYCGTIMRRAGTCLLCESCGSTSGCS